ncbi:MAG: type II toxin-antitoxin system VapC family toxin [Pyrinomonadaceae bacterium]
MRKARAIVLDSWAVLAFLEDEQPAAELVGDLIADAHDNGVPILMTVVNAGEVWYVSARRAGAAEADRTIQLLREIGVKFVELDWPLTKTAAAFKVKGGISLADCYAAAAAKQNKASLVTGDAEFRQVEDEVSIVWLNDI